MPNSLQVLVTSTCHYCHGDDGYQNRPECTNCSDPSIAHIRAGVSKTLATACATTESTDDANEHDHDWWGRAVGFCKDKARSRADRF